MFERQPDRRQTNRKEGNDWYEELRSVMPGDPDGDEIPRDHTTIQQDVERHRTIAKLKAIYSNEYLRRLGYSQSEIDSVEPSQSEFQRQGRAWSGLGNLAFGGEPDGPQAFP